jgi:hypothetical protein
MLPALLEVRGSRSECQRPSLARPPSVTLYKAVSLNGNLSVTPCRYLASRYFPGVLFQEGLLLSKLVWILGKSGLESSQGNWQRSLKKFAIEEGIRSAAGSNPSPSWAARRGDKMVFGLFFVSAFR